MPHDDFSRSRRSLLQASGATLATTIAGTFTALHARHAAAATAGKQLASAASPYGPIAPAMDVSTGLELLQLPAGFTYKSYGWTGDPMGDGRPTPSNHDGMANVSTRRVGRSTENVLVRNHERSLDATADSTIHAPAMY